ncbi:hypothetical protein H4R33_005452, partial [Dimargaris cristalligena]
MYSQRSVGSNDGNQEAWGLSNFDRSTNQTPDFLMPMNGPMDVDANNLTQKYQAPAVAS